VYFLESCGYIKNKFLVALNSINNTVAFTLLLVDVVFRIKYSRLFSVCDGTKMQNSFSISFFTE